jgi:hypothetical protein
MAVIVKRLGYTEISTTGGSSSPGYSQTLNLGTWVAGVGIYTITILQSVHGKGSNPQVQIFQDNGADFEEVIAGITLSPLGDVTIIVNSTPDARFQGKVIIQ